MLTYVEAPPSPEAYLRLRALVGWHGFDHQRTLSSLERSVFSVTVNNEEQETVACGRVVGDGGIYFYVQDILVHPDYQRQGIGTAIMARIMGYFERVAPKKSGAFLGLMVAPGLEGFYEKFGFEPYPAEAPALRQWRNGHSSREH